MKTKTRLVLLLGRVFIVLVAALVFMGQKEGCSPEPPTESVTDQEIGDKAEKTPYPKLEARLYQLTRSKDPSTFAEASGLYFSDGKVRVIIILAHISSTISSDFQIVPEGQFGDLLQAMVPVDQLCEISEEPYINFVRPPLQPGLLGSV